jgi:hypothetical protein
MSDNRNSPSIPEKAVAAQTCDAPEDHCEICDLDCPFEKPEAQLKTFRVHLVYRDVFEEKGESEEQVINRIKDFFDSAHDHLLLGNDPEVFAYEYEGPVS